MHLDSTMRSLSSVMSILGLSKLLSFKNVLCSYISLKYVQGLADSVNMWSENIVSCILTNANEAEVKCCHRSGRKMPAYE